MKLLFAKVSDGARIEEKRNEDAGYDIYLDAKEILDVYSLNPGETCNLRTGLRFKIPHGHYGQLQERSSIGAIGLKYNGGVIDSGFTGELILSMTNCSSKIISFRNNNGVGLFGPVKPEYRDLYPVQESNNNEVRINIEEKALFQMIILPVPETELVEITKKEMNDIVTERGDGGFGSTDIKPEKGEKYEK